VARRNGLPQFKLKSTVGSSDPVGPEDALSTKTALFRLGFLDRPKEGFSPYPDQAMFDGIRKFQKQKGLLDDGIMRPNGQTAEKIAEDLAKRKPKAAINDNATPAQTASGRKRKQGPGSILASGRAAKANAKSSPVPIPQRKPLLPRTPPPFTSKKFREQTALEETGGEPKGGYGTDKGNGALGRYQFRKGALKQIGVLATAKINGKPTLVWTGKYGVYSKNDFLNSEEAQERAFDDFTEEKFKQLKSKGALKYIGKVIKDPDGDVIITLEGLIAAAHHHGPGGVNSYLNWMASHGWDAARYTERFANRYTGIPIPEKRRAYRQIHGRINKFQNIPLRPAKKAIKGKK
jgi:hypothetical protein